MNLIRIVFLGLAVLLPTAWTMAQAADKPVEPTAEKKDKKSKKEGGEEKKAEDKK